MEVIKILFGGTGQAIVLKHREILKCIGRFFVYSSGILFFFLDSIAYGHIVAQQICSVFNWDLCNIPILHGAKIKTLSRNSNSSNSKTLSVCIPFITATDF